MTREERLKNDCIKLNVPYIIPQPNATKSEDNQRINILRRRIADERGKRLCAAKILQKFCGSTSNPPFQRSTSFTRDVKSFGGTTASQGSRRPTLDHVFQASRRAHAATSQMVAADLPQRRHSLLGTIPTTIFVPSFGTAITPSVSTQIESLDHARRTPSQIPDNVKSEPLPPATECTRSERNMKKRSLRHDANDNNEEQPESRLRGTIEDMNCGGDPIDQPSCKASSNAMTLLELCTLKNGVGGRICLEASDSSSAQSSWIPCVSTIPPKKRKCLPKSREGT